MIPTLETARLIFVAQNHYLQRSSGTNRQWLVTGGRVIHPQFAVIVRDFCDEMLNICLNIRLEVGMENRAYKPKLFR